MASTCSRLASFPSANGKTIPIGQRLSDEIYLAQLLEKGDFNALFLADTYGLYDTYKVRQNQLFGMELSILWEILQ
ncbi:Nitrilotriacetate monooxygenase component A/pristinamycin IIA synthase subunit A [Penicillium verrucosum]|uniref:Nitrilotriacetate monooxygenase component A/pristinamycin IIA synthase subunit A n=1 Tax=Penicillium verrucosum TaxID=60171 RepID=UPI002545A536|nr:Nitrilotriacetate monooxygenase component A/pristinamycin IIA synthase subunit A [Penicillium verrucosum]KAJ5939942.1 Nitrilotriacetate monooxygenase component A/pristinamycin IIA synthase subunit A [Penicillium verrucosum]